MLSLVQYYPKASPSYGLIISSFRLVPSCEIGIFWRCFQCHCTEDREEGNAMVPVEGFFLPAASIKAQKIPKGIRRNETSLIPEYISRKQSMRHGNDWRDQWCLYSTDTAITWWVGRPARCTTSTCSCTPRLILVFWPILLLVFCSGFRTEDF